jgi:hydrocephalus-inducing protein
MLVNRSTIPWHIRPVIEGMYWSGTDIIDIDPGQAKAYDVTYMPVSFFLCIENALQK